MRTTALVLAVLLWLPASSARAESRYAAVHFVQGATTVAVDVFYSPAKLIYAVAGGAIAGVAWIMTGGRTDTANTILQPAVRGDYVLSQQQLWGDERWEFIGRDPADAYPY